MKIKRVLSILVDRIKKDLIIHGKPTLLIMLVITVLALIPVNYEEKIFPNTERVPVKILRTNEQSVRITGMIPQGEQICEVEVLRGQFKGTTFEAVNLLMGNLENDKLYQPEDRALAVIDFMDNKITYINLVDHYRINWIFGIAVFFSITLIGFAGWVGFRSLLSFIMTILSIWKILIPSFLSGYNPLGIGVVITLSLTIGIIVLVYGFDRRSLAAVLGSGLGTLLTAILSVWLVHSFKIHGAVMPFSESLLYSGFSYLDLTGIFTASIFIACSGAMMDVAVDITSAVEEVIRVAPNTSKKSAIISGLNVGRAVMGTMTTTLLLAYSGSFISLLMVFMAQGTPIINIINLKYVSSEILHTLVGSFGLVTVAPFTAVTSGLLLGKPEIK